MFLSLALLAKNQTELQNDSSKNYPGENETG
jgi:hypothetical protein